MMTGEQTDIIDRILSKFGSDDQIEMIIEECSELILALQKLKRAQKHDNISSCQKRRNDVKSEIADVYIMVHQAILIFDNEDDIMKIVDEKLDRIKPKL